MKLLPVFRRHLEFRGELTTEKLTLENLCIAFAILSLGGTEPEIYLWVIYPPPQLQRTFKNTVATLGLIKVFFLVNCHKCSAAK